MTRVLAQNGDTADLVCWRELGTTDGGIVEATLTANPGLATTAFVVAGTPIDLPVLPASGTARTVDLVQLWD